MALANSRKVSKGDKNGIDPWSVNYFWDGEKWVIKNSDQDGDVDFPEEDGQPS